MLQKFRLTSWGWYSSLIPLFTGFFYIPGGWPRKFLNHQPVWCEFPGTYCAQAKNHVIRPPNLRPCVAGACRLCGFLATSAQANELVTQEAKVEEWLGLWHFVVWIPNWLHQLLTESHMDLCNRLFLSVFDINRWCTYTDIFPSWN